MNLFSLLGFFHHHRKVGETTGPRDDKERMVSQDTLCDSRSTGTNSSSLLTGGGGGAVCVCVYGGSGHNECSEGREGREIPIFPRRHISVVSILCVMKPYHSIRKNLCIPDPPYFFLNPDSPSERGSFRADHVG